MNTLSVSLGTLIDRCLLEMQTPAEAGKYVVLGGTLNATTDTTFILSGPSLDKVNVSDILEFGSELMLVTAKSADPTPIYTVARGYLGSTKATHAAGDAGTANPTYSRQKVAEAVRRSFARIESLGLHLIESATYQRVADNNYVTLPNYTRDVLRVGFVDSTGAWQHVANWEFIDDVPVAKFSTGKILRSPRAASNTDDLEITIRRPYRWSTFPADPTESATITVYEGAEDLPASYAKAWLVGSREVSRQQIDRAEEWNQGEPARGGVSLSLLRTAWQDFYRALDEARRLVPAMPIHRPYQRMPRSN